MKTNKNKGFTLLELLVVLAIVAVMAALIFAGFSSMADANRKTQCQTNLAQIGLALKLYAADNDGGYPYYQRGQSTVPAAPGGGLGLWALYAFPASTPSQPDSSKPLEIYLRKPGQFHCPADLDELGNHLTETDGSFNLSYLSYQKVDNGEAQYQSVRTDDASDPDWKRQLVHYNGASLVNTKAADNTVITWCPFHPRVDVVLFLDGSIQSILKGTNGTGWRRLPRSN